MPRELIQEYLPFLPIAVRPAAVEPHGIQEKVGIPMTPWRQRIAIFIVPRNAITPRGVPIRDLLFHLPGPSRFTIARKKKFIIPSPNRSVSQSVSLEYRAMRCSSFLAVPRFLLADKMAAGRMTATVANEAWKRSDSSDR